MKYTTLHKVMLTTMALVASLALNAQAGQPANSSAQQGNHNAAATASASGTSNQVVLAPSASGSKIATIPADVLWYNGDFDGINGLSNENNTLAPGPVGQVYDDFNVPSGGFDITSVFSNNLLNTTVTGATWEIRQGIVNGSGGTLIASGTTVTPIVTPTGRSGFGFTEFMVEVDGLSVHLDTGTYFLNVTPIGNLDGNRSFDSTTSGANCVGTPCGNDDNSWFNSSFFGVTWGPARDQLGLPIADFSMGVSGGGVTNNIVLTAKLRRQTGTVLVALNYTGTDQSGTVDILRNGVVVHTANDTGRAQDRPGAVSHVEYTYQVCETGTSNCSNTVTVRIQ